MFAGFVTWFCTFIYFLCTMFWVGFAQLVVSIMGVVVYAKYSGIQEEREYEAREAERAERFKQRGW
jgi:hypothetical protein